MKKINLLDKSFKTFIKNEQIEEAIDRVAAKMNAKNKNCTDTPILLCILNGSILFTAELMKRLDFNLELVSMKLSSYQGTNSTGQVREVMGMTGDVKGRRVIIVEDIVDTGTTIVDLERILKEKGATKIEVCTMLLKPDVYNKDINLDYVAMEIPNDFIVGFGLDYNELGRNFKDIYVIDDKPDFHI
ncbi:MAG: hypoxanthine phosphoribosyltransferase [Candidatus Cryptobacteroides sp.]|jgi:hypoxanthine phosphoribosyltransferase